ncbi:MAG TPA: hypothetical protein VMU16_07345 [Candidatus Binataceae bacterium]|nr:hypothetical protein [Candidatus Binataceae bacterium]
MAATTTANHPAFAGFRPTQEQTEVSPANRIAQNSILTELPGAAFAFLTLAYIVLSFAGL